MSSDDFLDDALPWSYYPSDSIYSRLLRNTHVPLISRLPPEILSTIFLFYQHLTRSAELKINWWYPHPYRWVKITHVCHQWREVALGLCELWTEVWCTSKTEIAEMSVRRAGGMKLKFTMERNMGQGVHERFLKLVLENLDRAEAAQIQITVYNDSESEDTAVQTTTVPCRSLRSLQIIADDYPAPLVTTTHDTFLSLLTKDTFPALTRLGLSSCRPLWHKDTFPRTLRDLWIRYTGSLVFADARLEQSVLDIAAAVSELTNLQMLSLINVLPSSHGTAAEYTADTNLRSDLDLFKLPQLVYLHIECGPDTPFAAAYFLSRFELPRLRHLYVRCNIESGMNLTLGCIARLATSLRPYFDTICRNLATDRRPITQVHMESDRVEFEEGPFSDAVLSSAEAPASYENVLSPHEFKPGFVFYFSDVTNTPDLFSWISHFIPALLIHTPVFTKWPQSQSTPHVTSTNIDIEYCGLAEDWVEALRCLPNVTHLQMTRCPFLPQPTSAQIDFFEEVVMKGLSDRRVMPELREVALKNVYVWDEDDLRKLTERLHDALMKREEFGMAQLEKLTCTFLGWSDGSVLSYHL